MRSKHSLERNAQHSCHIGSAPFLDGVVVHDGRTGRLFQLNHTAAQVWRSLRDGHHEDAIVGSLATREAGEHFNRLIFMRPDGTYERYDKRHLFRMAHEHDHYTAGTRRVIVEIKGWKVRPLVCYDLRFPVWSRNRLGGEDAYDVLLYVANWPERRRYAWQTLIKARAIENLSYCIAVNCVGKDGNGINYSGDSAAIDYLGQPMTEASDREFVTTATLDRAALQAFRNKFPAHLDADEFQLSP